MPGRETVPVSHDTPQLIVAIKDHFNDLIGQNLAELYGVSTPDNLAGKDVAAFEIAESDEAAQGSLMKVWFTAYAGSLIQQTGLRHPASPKDASQAAILYNHRRLQIPQPPKFFRIIPGGRDRDPYQRMLSRIQTADGGVVPRTQGTFRAAQILTGEVVLTDPVYRAIHPDEAVREQIAVAFLK